MKDNKKVKITFHTIVKRMWKKIKNQSIKDEPFWMAENILSYIQKMSKKERFYNLKGGKICFLESLKKEVIDENTYMLSGHFKSARTEFRPDLIDKKTGKERENPKKMSEGDIEKTHFVLKFSKEDEVYLLIERNPSGINIDNFVNYITFFTKKYLEERKEKKNFTILHLEIPRNNFLTELENLERAVQTEVYFDKKLLGSNALNFSERTISLKRDVILVAKASIKESITEFGVDLWNKMQQKSSLISKIRIKGRDNRNNEVLLDTNLMCKADFIEVDINKSTGDLNTIQLLTAIKNIAKSF